MRLEKQDGVGGGSGGVDVVGSFGDVDFAGG